MKRKRVGAGQRGSSNPYTVAKDLLRHSESSEVPAVDREASSAVTSSIKARAAAAAASLGSPSKTGRATSKKQQKLAEAAKTSRDISQYFAKREKPASLQAPPPEPTSEREDLPEAGGCRSPPSAVREEIMTVPKEEEEEDGNTCTDAFSE